MSKKINYALVALNNEAAICGEKLRTQDGDFAIDKSIVYVIAIALGAVAMGLLVAYFKEDLSNLIKEKMNAFFNIT